MPGKADHAGGSKRKRRRSKLMCVVCMNARSAGKCPLCFNRYYCSRECQLEDWDGGHKANCTGKVSLKAEPSKRKRKAEASLKRPRAASCSPPPPPAADDDGDGDDSDGDEAPDRKNLLGRVTDHATEDFGAAGPLGLQGSRGSKRKRPSTGSGRTSKGAATARPPPSKSAVAAAAAGAPPPPPYARVVAEMRKRAETHYLMEPTSKVDAEYKWLKGAEVRKKFSVVAEPWIKARQKRVRLKDDTMDIEKGYEGKFCNFCSTFGGEMLQCHRIMGHRAHQACLDYTAAQFQAAKSWNWECSECLECDTCNSSADPDSILACDRCNRGRHVHCAKLSAVPENDWFCGKCEDIDQK